MQNGKGSKRRPESVAGKYIQNYDEINWGKKTVKKDAKVLNITTNK